MLLGTELTLTATLQATAANDTTQTECPNIAIENEEANFSIGDITAGVTRVQYETLNRYSDISDDNIDLSVGITAGVTTVQYATLNESLNTGVSVNKNESHIVKQAEVVNEEVIKEPEVDPDDLYALSHLIYAEAGSEGLCSDELRYCVGSVVLNRVKSEYYEPDTIEGVIFQKGQYECTWLGTYYEEPTEKCVEIAKDLLINGSVLPDNVVFQAEFKQGDGVYDYIDGMYFCYKN